MNAPHTLSMQRGGHVAVGVEGEGDSAVTQPFFGHSPRKKDAQTHQRTVEVKSSGPANTRGGGSGDAGDGQVTMGTPRPRGHASETGRLSAAGLNARIRR
jgi:hypothetical protein